MLATRLKISVTAKLLVT
ncbi:hypothetical protein SAMN05660706_11861 [Desulfoscipio geothermicus DSM 3669]|uniref:Uncharacterized protein n=1 Tax=Desulfoscipio geothermicus DSM 3669 TaxID=1121426 RepID=A0A1I6DVA1_9FIRM|nr:hypothetical protein SAMN05660706_11861 [Desulfoscipio geothermicus DSM 3669]